MFFCNSITGHQIATQFFACQHSIVIVSCAKFNNNHFVGIEVREKRYFHVIRIAIEKAFLKWTCRHVSNFPYQTYLHFDVTIEAVMSVPLFGLGMLADKLNEYHWTIYQYSSIHNIYMECYSHSSQRFNISEELNKIPAVYKTWTLLTGSMVELPIPFATEAVLIRLKLFCIPWSLLSYPSWY